MQDEYIGCIGFIGIICFILYIIGFKFFGILLIICIIPCVMILSLGVEVTLFLIVWFGITIGACFLCGVYWEYVGIYVICLLVLIGIIGMVIFIRICICSFKKHNFYLKNADRKLELIDSLTVNLNKLYCISNGIIEYEKIKPFISLLEKCSGNESDNFKILDDAVLKSIGGNEIEFDIDKIRYYNFESVQKEIEVLKEELKLVECELISESRFECMYNKYKNYEI